MVRLETVSDDIGVFKFVAFLAMRSLKTDGKCLQTLLTRLR